MFKTYLFRVVLIPAGVFVSVMFGGGASTGLEITTYMSSNGPVGGIIAIGIIALMYSLVIFACYEIARVFRAYDYQSFSKVILGSKAWIVYEVAITLSMFGVLAYSTTGGGTALADYFILPRYAITAAILAIVILMTFQGRRLIEVSMLGTTLMLLGCAALLVVGALQTNGAAIASQLQQTEFDVPAMAGKVWVYSVVVAGYIPIILYAARDLKTRSEVIIASIASGIVIMLPPLGMHLAYLSRYPEILDQSIPNAWIAGEVMPGWFTGFFILVLNLVILQTAVGLLQGIIERLDAWSNNSKGRALSRRQHAIVAAVCLTACLGLSAFGVQRLLGWMYDISYWLFLVIFVVPLTVVGSYKIWRSGGL